VAFGDLDKQGKNTDEATLLATLMGLVITHTSGRVKLLKTNVSQMSEAAFKRLSVSGFPFK
jgi:hypothetical protein